MDTATKKFIENQTEKLATMVAQGFAEVKKDTQDIRAVLETKADKADIERLEGLVDSGMSRRMEETDRVADRLQRLEVRVTRLEVTPAR